MRTEMPVSIGSRKDEIKYLFRPILRPLLKETGTA